VDEEGVEFEGFARVSTAVNEGARRRVKESTAEVLWI